jgi:small subunit ribosomal protein S1
MTNFGVFVEIEPGIDGMVHISDLSWTKKFNHPSEMVQKGQEVECVVLEVNEEKRRVSLGIKQLTEDPWIRAIPEKYIPGQIVKGTITKLTNFGAFVELEPDLEGLLHISELADHKIDKPQDVVNLGEEVEVKILRIDAESRKIGLSLRRARWAAEEQAAEVQAGKPEEPKEQPQEPSAEKAEQPSPETAAAVEKAAAAEGLMIPEVETEAESKEQTQMEPEQEVSAAPAQAGDVDSKEKEQTEPSEQTKPEAEAIKEPKETAEPELTESEQTEESAPTDDQTDTPQAEDKKAADTDN